MGNEGRSILDIRFDHGDINVMNLMFDIQDILKQKYPDKKVSFTIAKERGKDEPPPMCIPWEHKEQP